MEKEKRFTELIKLIGENLIWLPVLLPLS